LGVRFTGLTVGVLLKFGPKPKVNSGSA